MERGQQVTADTSGTTGLCGAADPHSRAVACPLRGPDRTPATWTRVPRPKPSPPAGTAALTATIGRVAPDILALLADGVPRRKPAIVAALAGRHAEDDVELTLIRLAVTEKVREPGGRYTLATAEA